MPSWVGDWGLHFAARRAAREIGECATMSDRQPALAPGGVANPILSDLDLPLAASNDPSWLLVEEGGTFCREHEIESIFAIANGFIGTRASLEEGSQRARPATFAAGIYVDGSALKPGPALAVLPDWPLLTIIVDGETLSMASGQVLEHRRMLDLRQGVLWREWRQQNPSGRITQVRLLRLASLADPHVLLQSVAVTAQNYRGRIELLAGFPAAGGCGEAERPSMMEEAATAVVEARGTLVAMASGSVWQPRSPPPAQASAGGAADHGEGRWWQDVGLGETIRLDRVVTVYTSRDVTNPRQAAREHVAMLKAQRVQALAVAHADAWRRRWDAAHVTIVGDEAAQRALRFAVYHLVATANPRDERASIGARGLTGETYRGHVFWDTEIYMLPFYVFTDPPAARALLMYRYHTLGAARRKAQALGYQGALYAWESADTGEEVTPQLVVARDGRVVEMFTGQQGHHISADVAYGIWHYWRTTGDDDFILGAGAEILIETARFWASRARIETDGRAHIRAVIGPDEYHPTVDDNAYTNVMARWNLHCAADTIAVLQRERPSAWAGISARLALAADEAAAWRGIADALVTGLDPDSGLFEQFEGYFDLDDVDVIGSRNGGSEASFERERVRQSKMIKQADVVALCLLLWDQWPRAVHEANFRYYEPRTAHGSSLSPALHALIAARLGDGALARRYMQQASDIDLANNAGTVAGGVHMAALGGLWQAAVFGVAGVRVRDNGIALDPQLPEGWTQLGCCVQWRQCRLRLILATDPARIEIAVEGSGELTIALIDGPACRAYAGRRYAATRERWAWGGWRELEG
jgi:trehalose/maltose hydrolase-like predicted phosphorylase